MLIFRKFKKQNEFTVDIEKAARSHRIEDFVELNKLEFEILIPPAVYAIVTLIMLILAKKNNYEYYIPHFSLALCIFLF
jgi:hypothetical protein